MRVGSRKISVRNRKMRVGSWKMRVGRRKISVRSRKMRVGR